MNTKSFPNLAAIALLMGSPDFTGFLDISDLFTFLTGRTIGREDFNDKYFLAWPAILAQHPELGASNRPPSDEHESIDVKDIPFARPFPHDLAYQIIRVLREKGRPAKLQEINNHEYLNGFESLPTTLCLTQMVEDGTIFDIGTEYSLKK